LALLAGLDDASRLREVLAGRLAGWAWKLRTFPAIPRTLV